jgi:hypothetical protein
MSMMNDLWKLPPQRLEVVFLLAWVGSHRDIWPTWNARCRIG